MHASDHVKPASRIWYFDLLRIVASYGIVVLHASPIAPQDVDVFSSAWRILITRSILFRWSVPMFLMISGALFLSPDKALSIKQLYRKSIARIVTSFLFWSGIYALCHCIIYDKGIWTFLNQLLRGHYHMWFLFVVLALYMLTPLLRSITASKERTQYFLILSLIFTFLIPHAFACVSLFNVPHADVVLSLQSALTQVNPVSGMYSVFYYVLGYYLHAYSFKRQQRVAIYVAGIAGFLLSAELTVRYARSMESVSGLFYDISSPAILAMAAAVFLFFQSAFSDLHPGKRFKQLLLCLSLCSYGIYLVHPFIIERLSISLPAKPAVILLGAPLLSLTIYLLSLLISALFNIIPILKKIVV